MFVFNIEQSKYIAIDVLLVLTKIMYQPLFLARPGALGILGIWYHIQCIYTMYNFSIYTMISVHYQIFMVFND